MYDLLRYMLKEEVRLHTSLYKSRYFFTFPFIVFLFSAFICWGILNPNNQLNINVPMSLFAIYLFFITGLINGAFGLHARDYLERRFGEFGKLFGTTLILPISLRKSFITLAINDIIFYMFWLVIPIVLGYLFASIILGLNIIGVPIVFLSLSLAFLYGILVTFFLSVLFEKSKIISIPIFLCLAFFAIYMFFHLYIIEYFPAYLLLNQLNFENVIINLGVLVFLFILIYLIIGEEYETKVKDKQKENSKLFSRKISPYLAKDIIDLQRTGGLFAKPFFIVFLPSIFLIVIFSTMSYFGEIEINLMFFAIIIGTLSSTILNSLMSSDSLEYYKFLPVGLMEHVKNKIKLSFIIGLIQGIILIYIFSLVISDSRFFLSAVILFCSFLIYNLNLNFYLSGIKPYEYLFNGKVIILYCIFLLPFLIIAMIVSVLLFKKLVMSIILFVILLLSSKVLFRLGLRKWRKELEVS